jgi:hypothetical protein
VELTFSKLLLVEALIKAIEQRKMRNSERCFASSLAAEVEGEQPSEPASFEHDDQDATYKRR